MLVAYQKSDGIKGMPYAMIGSIHGGTDRKCELGVLALPYQGDDMGHAGIVFLRELGNNPSAAFFEKLGTLRTDLVGNILDKLFLTGDGYSGDFAPFGDEETLYDYFTESDDEKHDRAAILARDNGLLMVRGLGGDIEVRRTESPYPSQDEACAELVQMTNKCLPARLLLARAVPGEGRYVVETVDRAVEKTMPPGELFAGSKITELSTRKDR